MFDVVSKPLTYLAKLINCAEEILRLFTLGGSKSPKWFWESPDESAAVGAKDVTQGRLCRSLVDSDTALRLRLRY